MVIKEISGKFKSMTTDVLGNIYLVNEKNQIMKFDSLGQLRFEDNVKQWGEVNLIDASNPFEIQVWFQGNGKVVFLDNTLAHRGELDLFAAGFSWVGAQARSFENGLWIFDLSDLMLKRLNRQGKMQQQSANAGYMGEEEVKPIHIFDHQNRIYVSHENQGVWVFDQQANFIQTLKTPKIRKFQVQNDHLIWLDSNQIRTLNLKTQQIQSITVPFAQPLISLERQGAIYVFLSPDKAIIARKVIQ